MEKTLKCSNKERFMFVKYVLKIVSHCLKVVRNGNQFGLTWHFRIPYKGKVLSYHDFLNFTEHKFGSSEIFN